MADNPFGFWTEEWRRAQENYWSAWQALSGLSQADKGSPKQSSSPWSEALEQWWQSAAPAAPAPVQEFYAHLIDQGKVFYNLTESWNAVSGTTDSAHAMEEWQRMLQKSLEGFKASALTGHEGGNKTFREMMSFWELPMDTWERTASVMSGLPGDFLESFKLGASGDKADLVREQLHRFLSVPGLGYTREHQEQYQSLTRLMIDYQYAKQEFTAEFVKIAAGTVERFQAKTQGLSATGESVTTLQGFYDLWVDAAEDAYSERVFSEDYARAHGRLVNSLMAVKRQGRTMVDEAGEVFRQFVKDFYQGNKLIKGEVELDGRRVDLGNITMPVLNIYAKQDHLVPPNASIPLGACVKTKDYTELAFKGGHIGIYVSGSAQREVPPAIGRWLDERC